MSLVAYGASDDSGESDEETPLTTTDTQVSKSSLAIVANNLPSNNNNTNDKIDIKSTVKVDGLNPVEDSISDEDDSTYCLKGLPAPKQLSGPGRLDIAEDDVLEDMVKAKPSQLPLITPPTKTNNKGKRSVKITVPALTADSDEDEPQRKKIKNSVKGSGLFSLLPAPRNISLKETNRLLLPHTLKKTVKVPKSTEKLSGRVPGDSSTVRLLQGSAVKSEDCVSVKPLVNVETGSDSDEEGVSFFSLTGTTPVTNTASFFLPSTSVNRVTPVPSSTAGLTDSSDNNLHRDVSVSQDSTQNNTPLVSNTSEDLPLSFKTNSMPESQFNKSQTSYPSYSGHPQYPHGYPTTEEYLPEGGESEMDQVLQDEEFLKLQGKAGRGREQVKFIDIDTNQFTGTQDLMKTLTVEKEHTAHRKKDNQPSGRQRNKHQITYLAFQAKERELTLKNQWSQNKQTRRQTQSKYGF